MATQFSPAQFAPSGVATVANGGTGASTLTTHGVLVGQGTSALHSTAAGTNGQLLVGSTGADPAFATLTVNHGLVATTGAGTLTVGGATTIADPGASGAIPVTNSGMCPLVTAGAETRTMAAPSFANQLVTLAMDTHVGTCTVTLPAAFDGTHTNTALTAVGQSITFVGITVASALRWALVGNNGTTLS